MSDVLLVLVNSIKKPKRGHNLRSGHLKSLIMKMIMSKFYSVLYSNDIFIKECK